MMKTVLTIATLLLSATAFGQQAGTIMVKKLSPDTIRCISGEVKKNHLGIQVDYAHRTDEWRLIKARTEWVDTPYRYWSITALYQRDLPHFFGRLRGQFVMHSGYGQWNSFDPKVDEYGKFVNTAIPAQAGLQVGFQYPCIYIGLEVYGGAQYKTTKYTYLGQPYTDRDLQTYFSYGINVGVPIRSEHYYNLGVGISHMGSSEHYLTWRIQAPIIRF